MSDPSAQRPLINRIEDVDTQLKRVDELYSLLGQLDAYHAEAVKMLLNQTLRAKEPLLDELTRLEAEIRTFVLGHRRSLLRRFGRTIKLGNGIIKFRVIRRSLHTPKDTKSLINLLLNTRGGKRYLRVTWSLDRTALANAKSSKLWRRLQGLGAWVGKQEGLFLETPHAPEPVQLNLRRYPQVQ
ncbi:hypothetical protein EYC58_04190 [Candidatus Saccharibacteria bacterium]|nr:MAG: hypothetical protein EYC58_04190 [Candidatus Saccharibacteria bacterium]